MRATRILALAGAVAACGHSAANSPATTRAGPCVGTDAKLEVIRRNGHVRRVYVHALVNGKDALLLVDTGARSEVAGFHSLRGPAKPVANAIHATFACRSIDVATYPFNAEPPFENVPIVGLVGSKFFLNGVFELDLDAKRLRQLAEAPPFDETTWYRVEAEVRNDLVVVPASVDDRPTRLLVDTGVWNLILVDPSLDDALSDRTSSDAYGSALHFVTGQSTMQLGAAAARRVPNQRTREFAAFQQFKLGPDVDGLLGIDSFGASKLLFDFPHGELRFSR